MASIAMKGARIDWPGKDSPAGLMISADNPSMSLDFIREHSTYKNLKAYADNFKALEAGIFAFASRLDRDAFSKQCKGLKNAPSNFAGDVLGKWDYLREPGKSMEVDGYLVENTNAKFLFTCNVDFGDFSKVLGEYNVGKNEVGADFLKHVKDEWVVLSKDGAWSVVDGHYIRNVADAKGGRRLEVSSCTLTVYNNAKLARFADQARAFLLPYLASQSASEDCRKNQESLDMYNKTADPKYADYYSDRYGKYQMVKIYPEYVVPGNDCFTWTMDQYEVLINPSYNLKKPSDNVPRREIEGEKKALFDVDLSKSGSVNLQVGDVVKADLNPYYGPASPSRQEHWGIVVEYRGKMMIAGVGEDGPEMLDINSFWKNCQPQDGLGKVEVMRYGDAKKYAQHFKVTVSKDAKTKRLSFSSSVVDGPAPDAISEQSEFN